MKQPTTTHRVRESKKTSRGNGELLGGEVFVGFRNSAQAEKKRPLGLLFSEQLPPGYDRLMKQAWNNASQNHDLERRDANWCKLLMRQAWPKAKAPIDLQKMEIALQNLQAYLERYPEIACKYELTAEKVCHFKENLSEIMADSLRQINAFAGYNEMRKYL